MGFSHCPWTLKWPWRSNADADADADVSADVSADSGKWTLEWMWKRKWPWRSSDQADTDADADVSADADIGADAGFPTVWWSKSQVVRLGLQGAVLALAFMLLGNAYLKSDAEDILDSASVTKSVFAEAALSSDWYESALDFFETKSDTNGTYKSDSATAVQTRKAILTAYMNQPPDELEKGDDLRLLTVMIQERTDQKCSTGLDTFMVQWLAVAMRDPSTENPAGRLDGTEGSCQERLNKLGELFGNACAFPDYQAAVRERIKESYKVSWDRDLDALLGKDGSPSAAEAVLAGLEKGLVIDKKDSDETKTCELNTAKTFNKYPYARDVLQAQLFNIRETLSSEYRAKALIWGPLQWLLLTFFFAGCIALGQRRAFSRSGLTCFVRYRLEEQRQRILKANSKGAAGVGPVVMERAIKSGIVEELDEETSYPIELTKYVLPTVGFVGTVIGIAASLGSSGKVVEAAPQGVDAQLAAISLVTGQLGVAFDTTLLALAATAFIVFGHAYRRSHERRVVRAEPFEIGQDDGAPEQ